MPPLARLAKPNFRKHSVAANWINVGQTAGRGKKCPVDRPIIPIKDIWLYPLRRDFRKILRA